MKKYAANAKQATSTTLNYSPPYNERKTHEFMRGEKKGGGGGGEEDDEK